MARDRYQYELWCSACNVGGTATGSDDDNGPNFQLDVVPAGFTSGYSPNPTRQQFRHECGESADCKMV